MCKAPAESMLRLVDIILRLCVSVVDEIVMLCVYQIDGFTSTSFGTSPRFCGVGFLHRVLIFWTLHVYVDCPYRTYVREPNPRLFVNVSNS
jgi:hypothetical protein